MQKERPQLLRARRVEIAFLVLAVICGGLAYGSPVRAAEHADALIVYPGATQIRRETMHGTTSVPPVGVLTEVVVVTRAHSGESRKEIVDPVAISKIVRFIDKQGSGWQTPWYGIPIPSLELRLYDARQFKGSFGAGKTFFETQRGGAFFVKNVSPKDVTRLTVLVDEIGAQAPTNR